MNSQQLLNCIRLPARLDAAQTAILLGFHDHDIPILIRSRLLRPLGNPAPHCVKYFSAIVVEALAKDDSWLARATKLVSDNWRERNQCRKESSKILLRAQKTS